MSGEMTEAATDLHRLNGWSKSKGWWCSCGQWTQRFQYVTRVERGIDPWARRAEAVQLHAAHVSAALAAPNPEEPS